MDTDYNPKRLAQITFVVVILLGGLMVLPPFFATILVAAVVCITTWPVYTRLLRSVGGRDFIAASLMTLLLITIIIVPMAFFAGTITDGVTFSFLTAICNFADIGKPENLPVVTIPAN